MTRALNVGMVGYGFMARAHSNAWANVSHFFDTGYSPVLKAVAARNISKVRRFAQMWGYESVENDWRALIARKDIDAIDICVPNDLHAVIAIAAAEAGKMVLCEKPLARSEAEGQPMVDAVEKAGVPNMVWYNYRRVPAVTLIKQMVEGGRLGKIFHYRAKFLQDWTISPDVPQGGQGTWRLDVDAAGSGVTGDLLAHCLDTAVWINGSHFEPDGDDGNLRQTAQTCRNRGCSGCRHRRCSRSAHPFRQRLARHLRIHPLRPGPQGRIHPGDQRREGLIRLGPARYEPCRLFRPRRRRTTARLDVDFRHRRRSPLSRQVVGAWTDHRL